MFNRRMDTLWYRLTLETYSAVKRMRPLMSTAAWVSLRHMLTEVRYKGIYIYVLHYSTYTKFENSKLISGDKNQTTSCLWWGAFTGKWHKCYENVLYLHLGVSLMGSCWVRTTYGFPVLGEKKSFSFEFLLCDSFTLTLLPYPHGIPFLILLVTKCVGFSYTQFSVTLTRCPAV